MNLQKSIQPAVYAVCVVFIMFFYSYNSAAQIGIDTEEIESLINQWNYAHNARSGESFKAVYDDKVVFYTQQLSRSACIAIKQKLFRENRDYEQKITSAIRYKAYTSGVIKCDFTKEVFKQGVVWRYPAYLLVSYEDKRYRIVGESDDATDKTVNYYLKLGDPMDIPLAEETKDVITNDPSAPVSSEAIDSTAITTTKDSASNGIGEKDSSSLARISEDSSLYTKNPEQKADNTLPLPRVDDEAVTIPLQYVYIFIGLLVLGSLLILIMGRRNRKRNKKNTHKLAFENAGKHDHFDKQQSDVFEKFVLMLFDPLYFRSFKVKSKTAVGDSFGDSESYPHLELEFNRKEVRTSFAIESLYIPELKYKDIEIASPEKVRAYRQLDEDDNDLYLVLGIEGKPDDPKEIYLIPVREITKSYITYPELQPYRKYGMFFFNTESGRLQ